jgi:hypothetical protein
MLALKATMCSRSLPKALAVAAKELNHKTLLTGPGYSESGPAAAGSERNCSTSRPAGRPPRPTAARDPGPRRASRGRRGQVTSPTGTGKSQAASDGAEPWRRRARGPPRGAVRLGTVAG